MSKSCIGKFNQTLERKSFLKSSVVADTHCVVRHMMVVFVRNTDGLLSLVVIS